VGLAHKDGELGLVRAAGKNGIMYMIPTLSTYPLE